MVANIGRDDLRERMDRGDIGYSLGINATTPLGVRGACFGTIGY